MADGNVSWLVGQMEKIVDSKVDSAIERASTTKVSATVVDRDQDGTVWVSLVGSDDVTPCVSTYADAAIGDTVVVEINASGRASILGNYTSPAATSRKVSAVEEVAVDAGNTAEGAMTAASAAEQAASSAIESAGIAAYAAASAQDSADQAMTDAGTASEQAQSAQASATQANSYALGALSGLSDVEKVVGSLNWIAEHGTYAPTTDNVVQPNKSYYAFDGTDYIPVENPTDEGLYRYELTLDEAIDPEKTYYEQVVDITYEPTADEEFSRDRVYYVWDPETDTYIVAKNSDDGTGTFVNANGYEMSGLTVHGETRQDGTPSPEVPKELSIVTSNNILDDENRSYDDGPRTNTTKNVTLEYEGDGWWHVHGTVAGTSNGVVSMYGHETDQSLFLAGPGTYTLSMESYGSSLWGSDVIRIQCGYNSTTSYLYGSLSFATIEVESYVKYVRLFVPAAATGEVIDTRFRVQLERCGMAHSYAPHGTIGACSMSKNLLPLPIQSMRNGVTVTIDNVTGEITVDGTTTSASRFGRTLGTQFPPGAYTLSVNNPVANSDVSVTVGTEGGYSTFAAALNEANKEYSFVTDVPITSWSIYMAANKTADEFKLSPQLEFGEASTNYELHRESSVFIKPTSELGEIALASLPDGTKDTITVDDDGNCVLTKRTGFVDLGSLSWVTASNNRYRCDFSTTIVKPGSQNDKANAMCSSYQVVSANSTAAGTTGIAVTTAGNVVIYDPAHVSDTVEEFKAVMSGVMFCYQLAEPQTIDLGHVDLPDISEDGSIVSVIASFTPAIDVEWLMTPTDEQFENYCDRFESTRYVPVEEPDIDDLATYYERFVVYYELGIDVSVQNYIASHLALTDEGLNLTADISKYRAILGVDGLRIIDPTGRVVGLHGEAIQLGATDGVYFVAMSNILAFRTADQQIAWFGQNSDGIWEMHIQNTYAEDMVRFGDYAFIKRANGNMTLKWLGA